MNVIVGSPVFVGGFGTGLTRILNGIGQQLSEVTWMAPWLLAAPKQRRAWRDVRRRHKVQIREFVKKNRVEHFDKCENCGSPRLMDNACLVCFEFIRKKVNKKLKY